jgi:hypothetical protein
MIDAFVFYRSFFEAIKHLSCKDDKADIYEAIASYALDGDDPKLSGAPAAIFTIIKPFLDKNIQRAINGRKGGRPKQNKTEEKPNHNQTETKNEPSANQSAKNGNLINNKEINNKENIIHSDNKLSSCISPKRQQTVTFGYDTDAKIHGITPELMEYWKKQFPAVDIEQEIRSAEAWLDSNRTKRKHDIKRFLTSWLTRTQEKASVRATTPQNSTYQQNRRNYSGFDGNIHPDVSAEDREAYNGF